MVKFIWIDNFYSKTRVCLGRLFCMRSRMVYRDQTESQVSFGNHSRSIEMDKITIPISILKSFTKSVNLSDQLIIQFGHGIPFSISYKINDLGKLSFYYKNCQSI